MLNTNPNRRTRHIRVLLATLAMDGRVVDGTDATFDNMLAMKEEPETERKVRYIDFDGGKAFRASTTSRPQRTRQKTHPTQIQVHHAKEPVITGLTATLVSGAAGAVQVRAPKKNVVSVRLAASDNASGLKFMEFSTRKADGKDIAYRASMKVSLVGKTLWVRVRDGAGNWSGWSRVRVLRPGSSSGGAYGYAREAAASASALASSTRQGRQADDAVRTIVR